MSEPLVVRELGATEITKGTKMQKRVPLSEHQRGAIVAALYVARDEYKSIANKLRSDEPLMVRTADQFDKQSQEAGVLAEWLDDLEAIYV